MDEKAFKAKFKPALCTKNPIFKLIPYKQRFDVLRKIKQETIDIYGYSMEECPKRHDCEGECTGRELPWESPTARPYLETLAKTHKIKDNKLFVEGCAGCPIAASCRSVCAQIDDYMQRDKNPSPRLHFTDSVELYPQPDFDGLGSIKNLLGGLEIPWDSLNATRKRVIELYAIEGRDFSHVAKLTGLYNQAAAKYEFYAALTTLSEYAIMRKFLAERSSELSRKQLFTLESLYRDNKTLSEVANLLQISPSAITQTIKRLMKKYKLKWEVFVYKKNNKVYYNTSELFK